MYILLNLEEISAGDMGINAIDLSLNSSEISY